MMRPLAYALCMLTLTGCARSPVSLGLTGAPTAPLPAEPSDADIGLPGIQPGSGQYTPGFVPNTGTGRYFGYSD